MKKKPPNLCFLLEHSAILYTVLEYTDMIGAVPADWL